MLGNQLMPFLAPVANAGITDKKIPGLPGKLTFTSRIVGGKAGWADGHREATA